MIASATPASADVRQRLDELARRRGGGAAVLSVYLDTRWADEHQRERARIFLKGALAGARADAADPGTQADLDWIEEQGARLVEQAQYADAAGVALFACSAIGLRELVAVQAPLGNRFVVADRPALGPSNRADYRHSRPACELLSLHAGECVGPAATVEHRSTERGPS